VQDHFYWVRDNSLLDAINAVLVACARVAAGREAESRAGIIDSQPMKTTEVGEPRGYDADESIKDCKRHIVTYTLGNILEGFARIPGIKDRDEAPGLIERSCEVYPTLTKLSADGDYARPTPEAAVAHIDRLTIEIIRQSGLTGFVILPRRRIGTSLRIGRFLSHRPKRG